MSNVASVAFTAPQAARLGEALRQRAAQLGLSQKDLASATGMNRGHIARLQSGEVYSPQLRTLAKLERALQWEYGHAVAVALGAADPVMTATAAESDQPPLVGLVFDGEWLIVLREAASCDIMTQHAAATAALYILRRG